jgi:2-oxoglutarate ferredoxin oxidoreductase subunit gamma
MNRPSLEKFEKTVRPGGLLIVNSSLIDVEAERADLDVCYVPANVIAEELGSAKVANIVMLGAYLEKTKCVTHESVMAALTEMLGQRKAHLLDINRRALQAGAAAVKA